MFWNVIFLAIFAGLMGANSHEEAGIQLVVPDQLTWMHVNIGIISFNVLWYIIMACTFHRENMKWFQRFNGWYALAQVAFLIWGLTIMWGEPYSSQVLDPKPVYNGTFEAMVWIRFIGLLCACCLLFCVLCCLLPIIVRQQADTQGTANPRLMQSLARAPGIGQFTHGYIESRTREFDAARDTGATCTICFVDFMEEPERPIAVLECSSKHVFHSDCLKKWVVNNNTCPLCKEVIPDKV